MTDYVKSTNFASKDSLASGNPLKIVKGTEIDIEFNNIATAVSTKVDAVNAALSGIPTAPTAVAGTNTTQIATTAFVASAVTSAVTGISSPYVRYDTATQGLNSTQQSNARANISVPSTGGAGASGTWAINITGNAATASNAGVTSVNGMTGAVSIPSSGAPSTAQVLAATAGATAGAVGTYAMAQYVSAAGLSVSFGGTASGASLIPASIGGGSGSVLTGTWRCLGYAQASPGLDVTLWLRIS